MDPIRVDVTTDLINNAVQQHTGNCPIARALRLVDDDIQRVRVTRNEIAFSVQSEGYRYVFRTPQVAKSLVDRFDAGVPISNGIRFTLDPNNAVSVKPIKRLNPLQERKSYIPGPNAAKRPLARRERVADAPQNGTTRQGEVGRPFDGEQAEEVSTA